MRQLITYDVLEEAWERSRAKMTKRRNQKGNESIISKHEALGIISEEYHEFVDAVHEGNIKNIQEEMIDLAVAAIFSYASSHFFEE